MRATEMKSNCSVYDMSCEVCISNRRYSMAKMDSICINIVKIIVKKWIHCLVDIGYEK